MTVNSAVFSNLQSINPSAIIELFTPASSGFVTPNHALGGSTTVVVNVDASGTEVQGDEEQGRELGRLISVAVQSEIIQQQRPGGLLA